MNTGGAPIISYNLQYDQVGGGTGPWLEVAGETSNSLLTQLTLPGLTAGLPYYFRYRAKNVHGWSPDYSPIT